MILKVTNVAFSLSALAMRSLPPSGKEHWLKTREVIDDPCLNAFAIAWQRELVRQKLFNSTIRKEGARKNSVMLSANRKTGIPSSLFNGCCVRRTDSRFVSVVKAEHNVAVFSKEKPALLVSNRVIAG